MDWNFIQRFAPMYVRAAGLTLSIGLMGIGLSLVIGLVCCLLRWFKVPVLRQIRVFGAFCCFGWGGDWYEILPCAA